MSLPTTNAHVMHDTSLSRRNFLKTAGLATAALPFMTARSYGRILGSNERLNAGIIGCGVIAQSHLTALLQLADKLEIAAVSDVFETRARHFQDQIWRVGGRAVSVIDYRQLLELDDLDYVVVATPEHWHAQQALDALDAGLHVYCEKPMTHDVAESFAVLDKVRATGRKLQVGVQGMSDDSYAAANAAIRAGKLGPVVEAQIDYVRRYPADRGPWRTGVDPELPKPADLDWESWLGPAPKRPWSASRYFEWRNYRDYSGGIASDLFVHRLTRIIKACGLTFPSRVVGMGGIYLWDDGRELPDNLEMLAEYPAVEGISPGMTVHVLGTMANGRGNDHVIRGHHASLIFNRTGWEIIDQTSGEVVETHQKSGGEDIRLHHMNLHSAIREGRELACPAELGLYGVVAITGAVDSWFEKKMFNWDGVAQRWS